MSAGYRDALAVAVESKRRHDADRARRHALLVRLVGILNGRLTHTPHEASFGKRDNGGRVTVLDDRRVDFQIRVPASDAIAVATTIARHRARADRRGEQAPA